MDPPVLDRRRGTLEERVRRRLPDEFTNECWEWPGGRNNRGYAVIRQGGASSTYTLVSRVVCRMFHGPAPEHHRVVMHTCDNPPCVNPKHLVSGTHADNMRDKALKGRAPRILTEDSVRAIRAAPRGGRALAAEYGVSYSAIRTIRQGRNWAWVE